MYVIVAMRALVWTVPPLSAKKGVHHWTPSRFLLNLSVKHFRQLENEQIAEW